MKLLAIDGNSILNRAYYGIRLLSTKNGEYTNAVYGFINILNRLISDFSPDAVAVAFDLKKPTFRHKEYSEYKAGRKPMPDELRSQFPLIKEWIKKAGYTCLEKEGYEADDILGTLSLLCEQTGNECIIATGDRDALQLVSEKTNVVLATTKMGSTDVTVYTPQKVYEKYGLYPKDLIDLKAIMGDTSDNIPGVSGIGEKGAVDLIKRFSSVDYIYEHIADIEVSDGIRNKLINGKDSAYLSRFLGTIYRAVPISENLEEYKIRARENDLAKFMTGLELFSVMKHMGIEPMYETAVKKEEFKEKVKEVKKNEFCSGKELYLYFEEGKVSAFSDNKVTLFETEGMFSDTEEIKKAFNEAQKVYLYDIKNFYKLFKEENLDFSKVVFDTLLAGYLLNPSSSDYSVERLASEFLSELPEFDGTEENKKGIMNYALSKKLLKELNEKEQMKLLSEIELPLAFVLGDMELCGFLVDTAGILEYGNYLGSETEKLKNEIFSYTGYEFNLNSPKQLGVALFEKLGLPSGKKTKSGYSTNAEVLEGLRNVHPSVELLLKYRKFTKLKSTYCDALRECAGVDGRVHSTFNQTETRTGRISSLEPNLQNIPVREKEGRQLRKYFIAKDGYLLIDADYSQIELRVLAALSGDENMISAFDSDTDIHTVTASEVFKMPIEAVTKELRSKAKAVNFGIVYGIGAFSLGKDIGVSRKEAENYINNYLSSYKGIDRYMKESIENAKENGYVTTLFGRRRYLPELQSRNRMLQSFGERVARNAPIQGTAADIIKIAMIKVSDRLKKENLDAKLILQVHDELIIEAKEEIATYVAKLLKEEMENAVSLRVKLNAGTAVGKSWYDAKE